MSHPLPSSHTRATARMPSCLRRFGAFNPPMSTRLLLITELNALTIFMLWINHDINQITKMRLAPLQPNAMCHMGILAVFLTSLYSITTFLITAPFMLVLRFRFRFRFRFYIGFSTTC